MVGELSSGNFGNIQNSPPTVQVLDERNSRFLSCTMKSSRGGIWQLRSVEVNVMKSKDNNQEIKGSTSLGGGR